jgi:hypothetical protein
MITDRICERLTNAVTKNLGILVTPRLRSTLAMSWSCTPLRRASEVRCVAHFLGVWVAGVFVTGWGEGYIVEDED